MPKMRAAARTDERPLRSDTSRCLLTIFRWLRLHTPCAVFGCDRASFAHVSFGQGCHNFLESVLSVILRGRRTVRRPRCGYSRPFCLGGRAHVRFP